MVECVYDGKPSDKLKLTPFTLCYDKIIKLRPTMKYIFIVEHTYIRISHVYFYNQSRISSKDNNLRKLKSEERLRNIF